MLDRFSAGVPIRTRYLRHLGESPASGRNLGAREAAGKWVLFLDQDLLAGPQLVEHHVQAQDQRGGSVAIVGRISRHPQVAPGTLTKWDEGHERAAVEEALPLSYVEWRAFNLSLPKDVLLDSGGFDAAFEVPGLEDVELSWRLHQRGLQGFYARGAGAHAWHASTVRQEWHRAYAEGYTVPTLLDKTKSEDLKRHFLGRAPRLEAVILGMICPVCLAMCRGIPVRSAFFQRACRHVLRQAFLRGYRDAVAGLPPKEAEA
jgi:GT2 family glycosyltransferase